MDRSGLTLDSIGKGSGWVLDILKPGSNAKTAITAAAPTPARPMVTLRLIPRGLGDRGRSVLGAWVLGIIGAFSRSGSTPGRHLPQAPASTTLHSLRTGLFVCAQCRRGGEDRHRQGFACKSTCARA